MTFRKFRNGSALIACTIVLVVMSAMAVAMASLSRDCLQLAHNQQEANRAFTSAESGLEVMRYWLSRVEMSSATPPSDYLSTVISLVRDDLQANGVTSFVVNADGSIPVLTLDTTTGQSFSGQWSPDGGDPNTLRVCVTGASGNVARTLTVAFRFEPYVWPIFDFGLATKGAVRLPGNPTITAVNVNNEADIYIESLSSVLALEVNGNTNFDGDIHVGNAGASVVFDGDLRIADAHDQQALNEHVHIPAEDPVEFPFPDTDGFRPYATGATITAATDTSDNMTLTNVMIEAGANTVFAGNVVIQGILLIEQPDSITFDGNVDLQGMIVADGDPLDPGANSLVFNGNFQSTTFPNDPAFDVMRDEKGSSLLAPGFAVEMAGNFASLGGVMAVSGFHLSGNAGALIEGTVIDYSSTPTLIEGNATFNFDRSGMVEIPAGFDLLRVLDYQADSYAMVF